MEYQEDSLAYMRETNTKDLDTGQYDKKSYGAGVGFGVPMNEFDTVNISFDFDMSDMYSLLIHHHKDTKITVKKFLEVIAVVVIKMKAVLSRLDTPLIKEIVLYIQHLVINMILVQ